MDKIWFNQQSLPVTIAITESEQQKGLMGRQWPPPIMAFPYCSAAVRKFWMHNTPSPLDILFCRGGEVICLERGIPFSHKQLGGSVNSDLVVEMPRGMASRLGISLGTSVKLSYSLLTLGKRFEYLRKING